MQNMLLDIDIYFYMLIIYIYNVFTIFSTYISRLIIHSGGQPWVGFILLASFFPHDSMFFHVFPWDLSGPWLNCCRSIIQTWSSKICRCRSTFSRWNRRCKKIVLRLFQHTELEHTSKPLPTAISRYSFHLLDVAGALPFPGVRALGVCCMKHSLRWTMRVDLDRRGHPQIGLLG